MTLASRNPGRTGAAPEVLNWINDLSLKQHYLIKVSQHAVEFCGVIVSDLKCVCLAAVGSGVVNKLAIVPLTYK